MGRRCDLPVPGAAFRELVLVQASATRLVRSHPTFISAQKLLNSNPATDSTMPFSHHSHSGQFCAHAKGTLEEMVQAAIAKGFHTFALTEHIPRGDGDLYPEETLDSAGLTQLFDDYYREAVRLREAYRSQIQILIGMETEWIREPESRQWITKLQDKYAFDLFIGSVHHMHTVPIDFDKAMYSEARTRAGGTDERLFEDYFDAQLEMLQALRPPIVGHFDLVRLLSDEPNRKLRQWAGVWRRIQRNLEFIAAYGGLLELNTAGLRKGLLEPYPTSEICEVFLGLGGRFTLSDDSHQVEHVATNYARLPEFLERTGIRELFFLQAGREGGDARFPGIALARVSAAEVAGRLDA
ncbi:putative histidinol-phosphatase [Lasiodiplodia hormozganensis]|uniref:Histidinol-phosphatase n=2 Tax=Lasiodiplodia TaxID=66739 RepID=A0AA40CI44_9PEZI|nr:putative histidinol-phosphatase [Lasiodiplodia hormozganensis]